jgi:hypothetical protein
VPDYLRVGEHGVSEVIGPSPQIAPKKHCAGGLWQCRIRCRGRPM